MVVPKPCGRPTSGTKRTPPPLLASRQKAIAETETIHSEFANATSAEIRDLYGLEGDAGESMTNVRKVTLAVALDAKGSHRPSPSRALGWVLENFREARAHIRKLRGEDTGVVRNRAANVARGFVTMNASPRRFASTAQPRRPVG